RHYAAKLHLAVLDAAVGGGGGGGGAEVDRARHAPAGLELAEVRHLLVQAVRQRARAVDVLLDDGYPVVGKVAGQLGLHARIVDRDVRGHDQRVAVAPLPQAVDDGSHEAEHAAGTLELHQGGPVGVEPVEQL